MFSNAIQLYGLRLSLKTAVSHTDRSEILKIQLKRFGRILEQLAQHFANIFLLVRSLRLGVDGFHIIVQQEFGRELGRNFVRAFSLLV